MFFSIVVMLIFVWNWVGDIVLIESLYFLRLKMNFNKIRVKM